MKKILVAVDFSNASHQASEYAASLAKVYEAEITLLHSFVEPGFPTEGPTPWTITASALRIENEKLLNKEVEFLKVKYSLKVNGELHAGFKGNVIEDFAEKINADIVVLGMKSERKKGLFGSTATKMIRKGDIPVLIVPEGALYKPIKHVVLAVDFTKMVMGSSFDLLFRIIKKFGASLRVLHVDEKGADLKESEVAEKLQLGRALSRVNYTYDRVEAGNINEAIKNFTENHPADLLVMVAHHHNIFERLFAPTHTKPMSFELKLPLLVLKDKPE